MQVTQNNYKKLFLIFLQYNTNNYVLHLNYTIAWFTFSDLID